jgi:uncharacterized protein YbaP (TraB family)
MTGEWIKSDPLRAQRLKDKGQRRRRRSVRQDDIIELLALSAGWLLIVLGALHVAGLAHLPLELR